jgi:hypothetical protein
VGLFETWSCLDENLRLYMATAADRATGQEQEAKEVPAKLDKLDAGDAEFEKLLGVFIGAAREHIQFEETAVWPGLRTALNTAGSAGGRWYRPAAGTTARSARRLN